jgi:hypothetical protein
MRRKLQSAESKMKNNNNFGGKTKMRKIKRFMSVLLSVALVLLFCMQFVGAVTISNYELDFDDNSITRPFYIDGVPCDSCAYAYATTYNAEDCDLVLETYVENEYLGSPFEADYEMVAYVSVDVELDNGVTGSDASYVSCPYGADGVWAMIYGMNNVEYDSEDIVTYFRSTHMMYMGSRYFDPPVEHDQYYGSDIIHITSPYEYN